MGRTWSGLSGYLFARKAFAAVRDKMDPRKVNGGVFLGLNGLVIKSHGAADAEGFAAAVDLGYDMVRYKLRARISEMLGQHAAEYQPHAPPYEASPRDSDPLGRAWLRELPATPHPH